MDDSLCFTTSVYQNRYVSGAHRQMHAVLQIAARHDPANTQPSQQRTKAEVIVIDCSGSMGKPETKIGAARIATRAAIDALPDGVLFAVIAGTERAEVTYPEPPGLVAASTTTRRDAHAAVAEMFPSGGTAIGKWLAEAHQLLVAQPTALRHVLLLTDGKNEHETPEELDQALDLCKDSIICDARGIGEAWEAAELNRIATVLRGSVKSVRQPDDLEADFRDTMRAAAAKLVPEVTIRITTSTFATVDYVRQVFPTLAGLDDHRRQVTDRVVDFTTSAWGVEEKTFHICLTLDLTEVEQQESVRAARVDIVVDGRLPSEAQPAVVLAQRTDDVVAATRINAVVSHYVAQEDLSKLVTQGCDAYEAGDVRIALAKWTDAHQLAQNTANDVILRELDNLIEADPHHGGLRLRSDLPPGESKHVDVAATHSTIYSAMHAPGAEAAAEPAVRPADAQLHAFCTCGRIPSPGARFCDRCGKRSRSELGETA